MSLINFNPGDVGSLFKDIRKAIAGKDIKVQISYIKY
jgi:hypothetical protein